jgi:hypothetical protein
MAAFGYAILLAMIGTLTGALWTFAVGLGGAPGAMLTELALQRKGNRLIPTWGLVLTVLGQAYVALAFVAFVLQTSQSRLAGQSGFGVWVAWIITFFVATAPATIALKDAAREQRNVQHGATVFTVPLVTLGFFVFLFAPTIMHAGWGWVPHF